MTAAEMAALAVGSTAVASDLYGGTIPNWLTGGGVAAGLACGLWSAGARGLGMAAVGAVAGFLIFFLLHRMGGMGGGDVKLMAGFGALLGPADILVAAVLAAIAGAVLALAAVLWRPRRESLPYAPAIVLGAWLTLLGRA
jgi:prepilin peptidase CpaA